MALATAGAGGPAKLLDPVGERDLGAALAAAQLPSPPGRAADRLVELFGGSAGFREVPGGDAALALANRELARLGHDHVFRIKKRLRARIATPTTIAIQPITSTSGGRSPLRATRPARVEAEQDQG